MFLRDQGTPLALAERTIGQLTQYPPDQLDVTISLTDDVFLGSSNCARWQLGIPLLPPERYGLGGRLAR
jgi:hypothetical protein